MSSARHYDQDKDSTVYVGNIEEQITDALVWELMMQAGPVVNVHLPKDRVSQTHQGYGFVEFRGEEDADYACKLMNGVELNHKRIRVNKASADRRGPGGEPSSAQSIGAELFIGSLDQLVDERTLYDTFSRFGSLASPPKIARDDNGLSKCYGFISYSNFEAADDAIAHMHGQYLMNKEITVQFAFKKGDGNNTRHGDAAERALAAQAKANGVEVTIPAMPAALVGQGGAPLGPATTTAHYPPVNTGFQTSYSVPNFGSTYGNTPQQGYANPGYGMPTYGATAAYPPQQGYGYPPPQYMQPGFLPPQSPMQGYPATGVAPPPASTSGRSGMPPPPNYNQGSNGRNGARGP